jgi:hypothetical protein
VRWGEQTCGSVSGKVVVSLGSALVSREVGADDRVPLFHVSVSAMVVIIDLLVSHSG